MRIGISGAQSTGKSTLINALKSEKYFKNYKFVTENTRWVKSIGLPINEDGTDITQKLMMMKHVYDTFLYDNLVIDRTILDVNIYTLYLFTTGKISKAILEEMDEVFKRQIQMYDKIFYIEPEFAIEDDGTRSTSVEFQKDIVDLFRTVIKQKNVPVVRISGSVRERVTQILEALNENVENLTSCDVPEASSW